MVIVGLAIRFSVTESPAFEEVRARGARAKLPILVVVRQHLREVLLAAGAFIANNTLGYILIAYGLSYATTALKMPRDTVLVLTLTASAVWLLCVPLASILSDRIGRTRVLLVGSVGQAAWAAVLFPLIDTASPGLVLLALCGAAVFLGIVYGPMAALFSDLFSPEVRYSGTSLAYQLGAILGGGLAPTVSASLYAAYGSSTPITVYLVATGLVSLGCMYAATRRPV
ncbi:MFS transporter [Crossiella equi]|nr:MFS transporter [Crossiella equi]